MQSDQKFYPKKVVPPLSYEVGGYAYNVPVAPVLDATLTGAKHSEHINGLNSKSRKCPKNFIILDQTDNKCRIMFYPSLNLPHFNFHATCTRENHGNNKEKESSLNEDTKDIDALLSLEDEEDDEEVSTGRTTGNYGNSSQDSCSSTGSKPSKTRLSSIQKSFSCSSSSTSGNSERRKQKIGKMLKALREIVPGGDQMDTATVLDETVRYLKSLKVEVKKLGIRNFKKH